MKKIYLNNFGNVTCGNFALHSANLRNGYGKTTIVNAYLWLFSGRTIDGFVARKWGIPNTAQTDVFLSHPNIGTIKRTSIESGTTLYVNDEYITQKEFVDMLAISGINIDLLCACANVNILTNPKITSEDLRKLFTKTGLLDGDEIKYLRKDLKTAKEALANAMVYTSGGIEFPAIVEPLNASECKLIVEYDTALKEMEIYQRSQNTCGSCGQVYPSDYLENRAERQYENIRFTHEYKSEYIRLSEQAERYRTFEKERAIATKEAQQRIKARESVVALRKEVEEIQKKIDSEDEKVVLSSLPKHVDLVTQKIAANGNVSHTCELRYKGMPLKTVNRAKRVEICINILNDIRNASGSEYQYPIIVDNAEALDAHSDVRFMNNIILLGVL